MELAIRFADRIDIGYRPAVTFWHDVSHRNGRNDGSHARDMTEASSKMNSESAS